MHGGFDGEVVGLTRSGPLPAGTPIDTCRFVVGRAEGTSEMSPVPEAVARSDFSDCELP